MDRVGRAPFGHLPRCWATAYGRVEALLGWWVSAEEKGEVTARYLATGQLTCICPMPRTDSLRARSGERN